MVSAVVIIVYTRPVWFAKFKTSFVAVLAKSLALPIGQAMLTFSCITGVNG